MDKFKSCQPFTLKGVTVPKRITCFARPTIVSQLDSFSNEKVSMFLKNDQETGFLLGGNKVRKLEYIFHGIRERVSVWEKKEKKKCKVHIFTCGGTQSNHCRATAVLCKRMGWIPHLILRGKDVKKKEGNLFVSEMIDSDIKWITREEYSLKRKEIMDGYAKKFQGKDSLTFVIPMGASIAEGMWGYVEVIKEIVDQFGDSFPDHICCATGSAGTVAGLLAGVMLFKKKCKITGMAVCDNKKYFTDFVEDLFKEFNKLYKTSLEIPDESFFEIDDSFIGDGYGIPYVEEMKTIKKLASEEGFILDHCYTGKAFHGLVQLSKSNKLLSLKKEKKANVLFIHTGGVLGLFTSSMIDCYYSTKDKF